ncbi:MAG: ABC transporter substrate-binding protein [FCB group bacterium]|nr:ABC transporter substrate-binding protein [FCB group bacterium]
MSVKKVSLLLCLCLVVLVTANTTAENIDDSQEVVSLFNKGKRLLREGNWLDAANLFEELEGRFANSKNLDLFIFYRAKAKYYLGEYNDAIAGFDYFLTRYPRSPFVAYVYFFMGNATYLRGDVDGAVKVYVKSYRQSDDKNLNQLLVSSLVTIFKEAPSLSWDENNFTRLSYNKKCSLLKPLAKIYLNRGAFVKAKRLMALCGEQLDQNSETEIQARLSKKQLEVAVVLPFSGELHTFGEDIYNGTTIAANLWRQHNKKIKLTIYDTKGDPIEAARIIKDLSQAYETNVVIGPLTSEEAAVSSAVLNCSSLPMIAPAATQAGLTKLSPTSFQLSPNIELEGITLAEYAFNDLKSDSVAIISSTATDQLRTTKAFMEHFKKLGGTVVAVEYYRPRDKDFGAYIRDIKTILLGPPLDSTFFINENGDTLDFDIVPAYIDCLFLPGEPKQLQQLLPQIRFYNLNGSYLGSDGWGDERVYKLDDKNTKNAVFASPFIEEDSPEYLKFAQAFDIRFGHHPQRLSALGFDALRLIIKAVENGGISRENITAQLKKVTGYRGASGRISFGNNRENIEMPLYRIESQQAVLISPVDSVLQDSVKSEP